MKVLSVQTKQLTAENDEQSYEITLFSESAVIPFCRIFILQTRVFLPKVACSEGGGTVTHNNRV